MGVLVDHTCRSRETTGRGGGFDEEEVQLRPHSEGEWKYIGV